MAAVVGVMVTVSIGAIGWTSLKIFGKMLLPDITVMMITVTTDNLALAVLTGVIVSASTAVFAEKPDVEGDPEEVIIDFKKNCVVDMRGR